MADVFFGFIKMPSTKRNPCLTLPYCNGGDSPCKGKFFLSDPGFCNNETTLPIPGWNVMMTRLYFKRSQFQGREKGQPEVLPERRKQGMLNGCEKMII
jgi:hypothetical protein